MNAAVGLFDGRSSLATNLTRVERRIAEAANRVGRSAAEITLVAVTKTQPQEVLRAAYELGLRNFGENRVEEAESKFDLLPNDVTWHMIGHIQSRKARRVADRFDMVHSIDRVDLAQRLDRFCAGHAEPLPVLLEFNVTGEASKFGFAAHRWTDPTAQESLLADVAEILTLPQLAVQGLMTMAPVVSDPEQTRPVFARLRQLRDDLARIFPEANWSHLSMGMTDDFEVAIEEGATMVRVGRAIFAPELPSCRID
jgi:hypothetical protein